MSIVEFHGPPNWSLDASKTGERTKCPCREYAGNFLFSTGSRLESRDQDGRPSNSTIEIDDLTENRGL